MTIGIASSLDASDKLKLLGDTGDADGSGASGCGITKLPGVFNAKLPGGQTMKLARVMQTNACSRTCNYCATRCGRKLKRTMFKPDELAAGFMHLYRRRRAEGLFLTSGIPGDSVRMMDRMLETAQLLRGTYGYQGYLHLKILPGCEYPQIERACRLASRVSLNLEAPTDETLARIAPEKHFSTDNLPRLQYAGRFIQAMRLEHPDRRMTPAGVTTQFVVGAAGESDSHILRLVSGMLSQGLLHHAHYSAFQPVTDTPLESHAAAPEARGHRLYQADHLLREYGFGYDELPFDGAGNLPLDVDPKRAWALAHPERFPVELTRASRSQLLRVPGIGPLAASRLVNFRRQLVVRSLEDLRGLGVRTKLVAGFVAWRGRLLGRIEPVRVGPARIQGHRRVMALPVDVSPGAFR